MKKHLRTQGRDIDWHIHINDDGSWNDADVQLALLNDIREELKRLNAVLHCPNFIEIPSILRTIRKNTTKKRKPKAAAKPRLRAVS